MLWLSDQYPLRFPCVKILFQLQAYSQYRRGFRLNILARSVVFDVNVGNINPYPWRGEVYFPLQFHCLFLHKKVPSLFISAKKCPPPCPSPDTTRLTFVINLWWFRYIFNDQLFARIFGQNTSNKSDQVVDRLFLKLLQTEQQQWFLCSEELVKSYLGKLCYEISSCKHKYISYNAVQVQYFEAYS